MKTRESIRVWHQPDFGNTEVHRGTSVVRYCPPHWHEQYHLCAIEAGGGRLFYRGATHNTPAGSLFIVHPFEVHSNQAYDQDGCSYRNLYIDPEWIRGAVLDILEKQTTPFFSKPVLFDPALIKAYLQLVQVLETTGSRLERESLFLRLLANLIRNHASERMPVAREGFERKAVGRVRDYLIAHYEQNVSLEHLAQVAQLSKFYLNRVFSAELGLPPHAFQTQVRVAKAKTLLREGLEISQVALLTGFADQSHLNRHFKRLVGVTPGEYSSHYR